MNYSRPAPPAYCFGNPVRAACPSDCVGRALHAAFALEPSGRDFVQLLVAIDRRSSAGWAATRSGG